MQKKKQPQFKSIGLPVNNRTCEGCHACCVVFEVQELNKPVGQPCANLDSAGLCSCYQSRPNTCREYICPWKRGHLKYHLKPSKCGVLIEMATERPNCLIFFEYLPGALDTPDIEDFIKQIVSIGMEVVKIPHVEPGEPQKNRTLIRGHGFFPIDTMKGISR